MKPLSDLLAALTLVLLSVSAYAQSTQTAEPGTSRPQLAPASAAPQTHIEPNLRTDSTPHTNQDASTDSGPLPETLGMDATPLMDMGLDWSLPETSTQPTVLKRIATRKGVVSIVDVQTAPVMPLPVTNPPEPPSRSIAEIPQPPVAHMPTPQDPLTGIPQ